MSYLIELIVTASKEESMRVLPAAHEEEATIKKITFKIELTACCEFPENTILPETANELWNQIQCQFGSIHPAKRRPAAAETVVSVELKRLGYQNITYKYATKVKPCTHP